MGCSQGGEAKGFRGQLSKKGCPPGRHLVRQLLLFHLSGSVSLSVKWGCDRGNEVIKGLALVKGIRLCS